MKNIKTIALFSVPRNTEAPESTQEVNEAGETITVTKNVKKTVNKEFALLKPTRALFDDAELFYHVLVGKGLQSGLMSGALLSKRLANDGGVLSEPEKLAWQKKAEQYRDKSTDYQTILLVPEAERTEEQKAQLETLFNELMALAREMQAFENSQESLFSITAEHRARTHTVLWWMLFLSYRKNDRGEWEPTYAGDTYEEKLASYDNWEDEERFPKEEDRAFLAAINDRCAQAVGAWYYGHAKTQADFDKLLNNLS